MTASALSFSFAFASEAGSAALYPLAGASSALPSRQELAATERRLYEFVRMAGRSAEPARAFRASAFAAGTPEAQLSRMLVSLHGAGTYGWPGSLDEWRQALQEFNTFVDGLTRHIAYYAYLETQVAGQRMALSAVTWLGDFASAFQSGASAEQLAGHLEALSAAVRGREQLMQTFVIVARGAAQLAKIAVLATTPGGILLALAAALKFVTSTLEQLGKQA
jgi:hypothetical protein